MNRATLNQPLNAVGSAHPTCRLIVDQPAPGTWNMAVDEALLAAAIEEGVATLRLYQWNEPTLSLGYFQRYDDRRQHAASRECAVVRRSSGGGAILHDRELTYSLALPAGHPLAHDPLQIYAAVHQALAQLLASRLTPVGATGTLRIHPTAVTSQVESERRANVEPFLCFQRRSPGDVLLVAASPGGESSRGGQDWKIVGSAQRRRGGAILQHGSVLLQRSPAAPELPGWRDLTGVPVSFPGLAEEFPRRLSAELAVDVEPTTLPTAICDAARRIERAKYATVAWAARR